ncbi:MAG: hypothetical protein HLUCCA11_08805 [Phormidesmis priestleyi Ana]|uniref:Uncharacterized protein n=1 Tax=Phormidesmis priestleyi Ana TaxID=1666911 RepID=A0A0N8KNA4_9CYAN|nr:MAG: hypothetical protein HLUCCA11_08805 [Phormidesmis priestleyi Ana]
MLFFLFFMHILVTPPVILISQSFLFFNSLLRTSQISIFLHNGHLLRCSDKLEIYQNLLNQNIYSSRIS